METILGFLIALIVGMTGMGGGPLAAPILILGLGLPAAEAVGTSMLFVTVTKLVASPVYALRGQVDWRILLRLLLGGVPGVVLGSLLITKMVKDNLQDLVLAVVGVTIVVLSLLSLYRLLHGLAAPAKVDRSHLLPAATFPIGLEVGFSSAGAGALGSIAMMQMTKLEAAKVVGTDLLFGLGVSLVGGGMHLAFGQVNSALVGKLIVGGIAGALTGAWLGTRMPSRQLRFGLAGFLVFLGGQLAYRGLTGMIR